MGEDTGEGERRVASIIRLLSLFPFCLPGDIRTAALLLRSSRYTLQ